MYPLVVTHRKYPKNWCAYFTCFTTDWEIYLVRVCCFFHQPQSECRFAASNIASNLSKSSAILTATPVRLRWFSTFTSHFAASSYAGCAAILFLLCLTEFSRILAIVIAAADHCTEAEQKQTNCTTTVHACTLLVHFSGTLIWICTKYILKSYI